MKKVTVTIQIGNSDDKLTQQEWSGFVSDMRINVTSYGEVHFDGGNDNDARWQNYCWVVNVPCEQLENFKTEVAFFGRAHRQTSIAFTVGETFFV
jgi:hypothetical protein